jgi:hypothetical protein
MVINAPIFCSTSSVASNGYSPEKVRGLQQQKAEKGSGLKKEEWLGGILWKK